MYPVGVMEVFELMMVIWLLILSYLIWQEQRFLTRLFPKDQTGEVREKLAEVLETIATSQREINLLQKNVRDFSKEGLRHIQKLAVLKYNPYEDTGGSISFSIAFLDGRFDGLVLTSLHTRSGTRVYTKEIRNGKSELKLSKEEEGVIKQAIDSKD